MEDRRKQTEKEAPVFEATNPYGDIVLIKIIRTKKLKKKKEQNHIRCLGMIHNLTEQAGYVYMKQRLKKLYMINYVLLRPNSKSTLDILM